MTLTNEEKKKIADAAAQMMQTFCEFKLAEDRLATMNNLCSPSTAAFSLADTIDLVGDAMAVAASKKTLKTKSGLI